jgi:hypothetical protein
MNEWHDFFLAQAGAAGVLTGLVFVGVSINLQKIVSDPSSGLPCGGSSRAAAAEELGTMRPDLRGAFVLRVALA